MDDQKFGEIDDLFDITDTEASSSSTSTDRGVYEKNQPFVLELHELKRDDPNPDEAKRYKKKKRRPESKKSHVSESSDSMSEASSIVSTPGEEHAREQFYDAHESYHDLPETQTCPTAGAALAQAISQHGHDPKLNRQPSSSTVATNDTRTQASTFSKPSRQSK